MKTEKYFPIEFAVSADLLLGPVYKKVWYDLKSETFQSRIFTWEDLTSEEYLRPKNPLR
jgi:hypothetical protein